MHPQKNFREDEASFHGRADRIGSALPNRFATTLRVSHLRIPVAQPPMLECFVKSACSQVQTSACLTPIKKPLTSDGFFMVGLTGFKPLPEEV